MELRDTGIKTVGEMPWGTHFCEFYKTREDLLGTLVNFFKAGLEKNEFCLWLTSEPVTREMALRRLSEAIPDLDQHIARENIAVAPMERQFETDDSFDAVKVVGAWIEMLRKAEKRGLSGMRVGGDQSWQSPGNWASLCKVERGLNRSINNRRMLIMCAYPIEKIGADAVLDVTCTHEFAIAIREGRWETIESPKLRRTKMELSRVNRELEKKIVDSEIYIASLSREEGLRRQFVSLLTHDIRNPLGAAQITAQLLARKLPENTFVQSLTDKVVFALRRADSLIQELLDLNKILSHKPILLELEEIDLYDILEQLVNRQESPQSGRIVLSSPRGIIGKWDRRTLTSVLDTLITHGSIYADEDALIFVDVEAGPMISVNMHFRGRAPWSADRDRWLLLWTLAEGTIRQFGGNLSADQMPTNEVRFRLELPADANRLAA